MNVTKLHIASTRGANRRPSSGDVFFSDGYSCGWFLHGMTDEMLFSSTRNRGGEWFHFTFRSPKRAAALLAKLEG